MSSRRSASIAAALFTLVACGGKAEDDRGGADALSAAQTANQGPVECGVERSAPDDRTPVVLPPIDDCATKAASVTGVVSGPEDIDLFTVAATDDVQCMWLGPTAQLNVAGLELCVMAKCKSGTTSFETCGDASQMDGLPPNTVGCCAAGTSPINVGFGCASLDGDDSSEITMRVKRVGSSTEQCTPYELTYRF